MAMEIQGKTFAAGRICALVCSLVMLLAVTAAAPACASEPDVIRLRDGNVLKGQLVACDAQTVKFKTGAGIASFSRDGVASITLGTPEPAKTSPPLARPPASATKQASAPVKQTVLVARPLQGAGTSAASPPA